MIVGILLSGVLFFLNSLYVLLFIYLKSRQLTATYKAEDQASQ